MEYLDIYKEDGTYVGNEDRKIVHEKALWHKTIHCWLYDKDGNIYFQIRKDLKKLYTTASGHVAAGETPDQSFDREVMEEIGVDTSKLNKLQIDTVYFRMNRENKDGSYFRDRAFANIYICEYNEDSSLFNFDENEVDGLAKVNAKEVFDVLRLEKGKVKGILIKNIDGDIVETEKEFDFSDFLVNKNERAISKYGFVLERVIYNEF